MVRLWPASSLIEKGANTLNAADGGASPPVVSLVTVTYHSAATLSACWANLDIDWAQWVVVDNCSSDRSAEVARNLGATVIELPRNMGFSAATIRLSTRRRCARLLQS